MFEKTLFLKFRIISKKSLDHAISAIVLLFLNHFAKSWRSRLKRMRRGQCKDFNFPVVGIKSDNRDPCSCSGCCSVFLSRWQFHYYKNARSLKIWDDLICMCSEWVPEIVSTLLLHSCREAFHKGGICPARPLSKRLALALEGLWSLIVILTFV